MALKIHDLRPNWSPIRGRIGGEKERRRGRGREEEEKEEGEPSQKGMELWILYGN